jgi:hypothetical protein
MLSEMTMRCNKVWISRKIQSVTKNNIKAEWTASCFPITDNPTLKDTLSKIDRISGIITIHQSIDDKPKGNDYEGLWSAAHAEVSLNIEDKSAYVASNMEFPRSAFSRLERQILVNNRGILFLNFVHMSGRLLPADGDSFEFKLRLAFSEVNWLFSYQEIDSS